jgi:dephospho-CoA kinase
MGGPNPTATERAALEREARERMGAQMPDEEKIRLSDTIIRNDGSLEDVTRQTEAVYRELRARCNLAMKITSVK